jgi:hypothetical protein
MSAPMPDRLIATLQQTLASLGIDHEHIVAELGQVSSSEDRLEGKCFTIAEHLRGLVLSLLSSQRQWAGIARNLGQIQGVFFDFDPERVRAADPEYFVRSLRDLKCGNRQIRRQMHTLAENIDTFARIASRHGSLDEFITSADPGEIAKRLSKPGSVYKLRQVGYALALEYLRNVGIRASKPDVHVRRAIGGERLAYFDGYPTEEQAYRKLGQLAEKVGCNPTYLDNLLWIFCATKYGNVCRAEPRCSVCGFAKDCNFPRNHPGSI